MTVTIRLDIKDTVKNLTALEQKQIPFALSIALNRTVEDALAVARKEMREKFVIRVPAFALPPVKLPRVWQATKRNPTAIFALGDSDGGTSGIGFRRDQMFSKFQRSGIKSAKDPSFPIAIPTKVIRSSPASLVPRSLYPKNLRLKPRKDVDGSTLIARRGGKVRDLAGRPISNKARKAQGLEGIGGTFTINKDGRPIGIFQRTGRGAKDLKMIWAYRQSIRIPFKLDWVGIAQRTANTRFQVNFDGALAFALKTAK